jgi:hypothetical protein
MLKINRYNIIQFLCVFIFLMTKLKTYVNYFRQKWELIRTIDGGLNLS